MFRLPQQVGNDAGIKRYYENRDTLVTAYAVGLWMELFVVKDFHGES